MTDSKINIALDGYSSCGKSTIAKRLARSLGYTYVDTGAMYRGVTLYALREGLFSGEEPMVEEIIRRLPRIEMRFAIYPDGQHLLLNGEDVEREIRGMEVSEHVSPIATIPEVRAALTRQQQDMAKEKGVVMDGRDVGTTILPDAELKIFVTARPEVRARRRFDELTAKGESVTYDSVLANVRERDRIDSGRAVSPLRQAEDALVLDNSDMTLDQQQAWVEERVRERL
ncbi:MAG: (d)CMP kinase [Porphyromonas sp.]|uniref:(d)CMP kinase n=1 Tax=Porphyromonas sp. TaxID=1924944 RepID=UPI002593274A|nr:(d)CMP kinase [Porphyromonas sp.]MDD7468648.1 (d)CMP kinase [Bacteroidales bacterium]MDY6102022.1 (d)CMP kinase [Porphyromonas sp.]